MVDSSCVIDFSVHERASSLMLLSRSTVLSGGAISRYAARLMCEITTIMYVYCSCGITAIFVLLEALALRTLPEGAIICVASVSEHISSRDAGHTMISSPGKCLKAYF